MNYSYSQKTISCHEKFIIATKSCRLQLISVFQKRKKDVHVQPHLTEHLLIACDTCAFPIHHEAHATFSARKHFALGSHVAYCKSTSIRNPTGKSPQGTKKKQTPGRLLKTREAASYGIGSLCQKMIHGTFACISRCSWIWLVPGTEEI